MKSYPRSYLDVGVLSEPEVLLRRLGTLPPRRVTRENARPAPRGTWHRRWMWSRSAVADLVERGSEGIGVDRSDVMVQAARRRFPACTFVGGSSSELPSWPAG